MARCTILICMLILPHLFISGSLAATFTIVNKCDYTVWPGILSNAGVPSLSPTGFVLQKGETKAITAPSSWGGRFWGRTQCTQDSAGKFSCVTGDCGSGKMECSSSGATPPATLAEFTLSGYGGLDCFDVSLVDGYNLAIMVVPQGGTGDNCTSTGCVADLNESCPSELRVTTSESKGGVACKSACGAFGQPQYCCSGAYGSPTTCKPSSYSEIFKKACPRAYSYRYDDKNSAFTCASAPDYTITFCPTLNTSKKSSQGQNTNTGTGNTDDPLTDGTMVYEGGSSVSGTKSSTWTHVLGSHAVAGRFHVFGPKVMVKGDQEPKRREDKSDSPSGSGN